MNKNEAFLNAIDNKTRKEILNSIASHYGITIIEAEEEIFDDEAESLLDYMIEPQRSATLIIMKRHRLTA